MIGPTARGSPTSPLRRAIKGTRRLADELRDRGYAASATSVRRMLVASQYGLPGNRKTREGRQHPGRDGRFRHISDRVKARRRRGEPAASVDTKRKEVPGNSKDAGKTYRPPGDPQKVKARDFPVPELGKAVPYGVYDLHGNGAGVSAGISHDTAGFAAGAIRRWRAKPGRKRYRGAKRLLVTADGGGGNSSRGRSWKVGLRKWADETGLVVEVCHYPPGTGERNKVEHRLFCHVARGRQGTPLGAPEVVVESAGATATGAGLAVQGWLGGATYEKGRKVSDQELAACHIRRHKYHGEWGHEIRPRS